MEQGVSILVHSFQDAQFQLDNVPPGTTAASLLARLASLDLPGRPPFSDLAVQIDDQILFPTDEIDATEITIIGVQHRTSVPLGLVFGVLFLVAHVLVGFLMFKRQFLRATLVYLPLVLLLSFLKSSYPDRPFPIREGTSGQQRGVLLELAILFIYSLNPGFRLEHAIPPQ
jgi:hypothetical protein